jgi:hypothetical protein
MGTRGERTIETMIFYATICYQRTRPYMPDVPYLLPASSWSRGGLPKPKLPQHLSHLAADSGGFVATFRWGDYRYTPDEYVAWLDTFRPRWAATMDYCCEPDVAGRSSIVRQRQQQTSEMAWCKWRDYRDAPWAWVPTVQGWEVEDYVRHATELRPLIQEMQSSNSNFRVGIGTLCSRASTAMIHQVVMAVSGVLPSVPLHLWGVKLGALKFGIKLRNVVSVDSAAWSPSGLGRTGHEAKEERTALGMTQSEYEYLIALPRYLGKVNAALSLPKQLSLL